MRSLWTCTNSYHRKNIADHIKSIKDDVNIHNFCVTCVCLYIHMFVFNDEPTVRNRRVCVCARASHKLLSGLFTSRSYFSSSCC